MKREAINPKSPEKTMFEKIYPQPRLFEEKPIGAKQSWIINEEIEAREMISQKNLLINVLC